METPPFNVELMFKSSEVRDDALAAAANKIKANGVEGVTSQTSVDPMKELKVIPGIDTNELQTFDTEAAAVAAAAPSPSSEQPPRRRCRRARRRRAWCRMATTRSWDREKGSSPASPRLAIALVV